MLLNLKTPHIFLPGHVPSFKNSKRFVRTKNNKTALIGSKTWVKYEKTYGIIFKDAKMKNMFKKLFQEEPLPIHVGFYFIRNRRQLFDFHNICAGVLDLMVHNGWIIDDDIDNILPYPIEINEKYWHKDPTNSGTILVNYKKYLNGRNIQ